MTFLLISVKGTEIKQRTFASLEDAQKVMDSEFMKANGYREYRLLGASSIQKTTAYIMNGTDHCDYTWKIIKLVEDKEHPEHNCAAKTQTFTDLETEFYDCDSEHLVASVGDMYVDIEEFSDGYDYTVYDSNYQEIDSGMITSYYMTIQEALKSIVAELFEQGTFNGLIKQVDSSKFKEGLKNAAFSLETCKIFQDKVDEYALDAEVVKAEMGEDSVLARPVVNVTVINRDKLDEEYLADIFGEIGLMLGDTAATVNFIIKEERNN